MLKMKHKHKGVYRFPLFTFRNSYCVSIFAFVCLLLSCSKPEKSPLSDQEIVTAWADMTLYITQHTPANSPTFASRGIGYIGLTMYESIVHGYPSHQSLAGQLNGLDSLPIPNRGVDYNWMHALNSAQATIIKNIYNQTSDINKLKIDSLEAVIASQIGADQIGAREYGKKLAEAIFEWSKTDGGHRGYLQNFDKNLKHPTRPGSWKPPLYAQSFSHHPLHPHWGDNRTFVPANSSLEIPEMIPYDTAKTSPYYQEFLSVYTKDQNLTQAEKEAAIWWGDDPDVSFTPPGHSFYLANNAIKSKQPDLIICVETFAKVGMAVADAFINCWKWKYHYFSERPNTYIPMFIDPEWESFWPDPPFPSFPSGHAIQASAHASVMQNLYGERFTFIDSAHVDRERDEIRHVDFVARSFDSFWEVAQETADSRFYGGIHTPQDNRVGLEEGKKVATNVLALKWRK